MADAAALGASPSGLPEETGRAGVGADAAGSAPLLAQPVIELRGITKRFAETEVLSNVDLALCAGRVHALAGENGAGKSTLVKILGGIYQPDGGEILQDGRSVVLHGAAEAKR